MQLPVPKKSQISASKDSCDIVNESGKLNIFMGQSCNMYWFTGGTF